MKTALIKISLFFLLLHSVGASFALASNQAQTTQAPKCESTPAVCLATPESMNRYLDFQREIIALLEANPFETITETISRPDGGLFVNQLLKLPDASVWTENLLSRSVNAIGTAAEQILISNLTTLFLFELSAATMIGDGMMGFLILFQERPQVRDYKKLLEIEREYSIRAKDLGKQMLITKKIKNTAPLQKIIKKYQEKGLLIEKSQFPTSLHYTDLLIDLIDLNVKMKLFLGSTSTSQFSLRSMLEDKPSLYLGFNEDWIAQLEKDYRCVQGFKFGFKCNQPFKNFAAEMKHLGGVSKEVGTSAWQKIKLSIKRLNEALFSIKMHFEDKNNSFFSEYEKEILRSREGSLYHNDKAYLLTLSQRMKNQRRDAQNLWPAENFSTNSEENEDDDSKKNSLAEDFEKAQKMRLAVASNSFRQQELYQTLESAFVDFKKHEAEVLESLQLADSLLICREFGALALQIQEIAKMIGDKASGLRGQTYNVCSYQCSNKASLECYSK